MRISRDVGRPVAVDLFCGAGGLSLGLEQAGFDVALGVDFDRHSLQTYRANLGGEVLEADVRTLSGRAIKKLIGGRHIDLLAGGPSCQGFSTHGKRKSGDERNRLYEDFLRIVGELRPTTVLMENVKGLLSTERGLYRDFVRTYFESLGYTVSISTFLAADYGVPQLRERVFFLASRLGSIAPPVPTHGRLETLPVSRGLLRPHVSVGDAISDLPAANDGEFVKYSAGPTTPYQRAMRRFARGVWNHVAKEPSPMALSLMRHIKQGFGLRSLPPRLLPQRFKKMRRISTGALRRDCTTLYYRLAMNRPSYTITCYFTNVSAGAFTHPLYNRAITAREAARLQSFPDRFVFEGAQVPKQIGNAVPPLLGRAVGGAILSHLSRRARVVA